MRLKSILTLIVLLSHAQCVNAQHRTGNFVANDSAVVKAAEAARLKSAIFWTNAELPGDWYRPCPITVCTANHSGGGVTQFRFHDGEVSNWNMTVEGTREAILSDVIPHEVDHMVRASLVRKPIVRWLDEGCASFMESASAKEQFRRIALSLNSSLITNEFLNRRDYPTDPQQLRELYALGFSLVESLLERNGPATLLKLQHSDQQIEIALQQHYGLTILELRSLWEKSILRPSTEVSLRPITCQCQQRPDNLLTIWGAHWCGPCRQFWNDYQHDSQFRQLLNQHYHIHFHDFDQQRPLAVQQGIRGVPTFILQGRQITGYTSQERLLRELGIFPQQDPNEEKYESPIDKQIEEPSLTSKQHPTVGESLSPDRSVPQQKTTPPTVSQTPTNPTKPVQSTIWQDFKRVLVHFVPMGFTALQWTGILGGSFASGGIGALALAVLFRRLSKRTSQQAPHEQLERRSVPTSAPFPRQLDEARQLLKLRQSEGRVGLLDALRGMFLDDELEKMTSSQSPELNESLNQLRTNIDARVDEVAPLSTKVDDGL